MWNTDYYECWSAFEQFLWLRNDEVRRSKLNKREFVFVFRDFPTYDSAINLGTRICIPFVYHSDIYGCYYITVNYDFITQALYEHWKNIPRRFVDEL